MSTDMVDVTLHIKEETSHEDREGLRDAILSTKGVMAAVYHDEKPHLMIIEYDPEIVTSSSFIEIASARGMHSQVISL